MHIQTSHFLFGEILLVCGGGVCMCAWDQVTPCLSTHVRTERSASLSPLLGHHRLFVHLSVSLGFLFTCRVLWEMLLPARVSTDLLSVLRKYPEVGLLGHRVILILVFEEPPHCFPERLHHFVRHRRGFQFPSVWDNTTLPVCFSLFVLIVTILVTIARW